MSRRSFPTLPLAALVVSLPFPVRGAETPAPEPPPTPSRVMAVTIHRQHALVTREAEVVLAEGESRVVFVPLADR